MLPTEPRQSALEIFDKKKTARTAFSALRCPQQSENGPSATIVRRKCGYSQLSL